MSWGWLGAIAAFFGRLFAAFRSPPAPTPEQSAEDHARADAAQAAAAETSLKDQSAAIGAKEQEDAHVAEARAAGDAVHADLLQHPDHLRDDDGFKAG